MWVQEEQEMRLIQIEEVIKQNEKSDQKQFKTGRVKKNDVSTTFRVKLGLTAGWKGELHRLPCSLPLTH